MRNEFFCLSIAFKAGWICHIKIYKKTNTLKARIKETGVTKHQFERQYYKQMKKLMNTIAIYMENSQIISVKQKKEFCGLLKPAELFLLLDIDS